MGKAGSWFGAVKRVFSPEPKEKKSQREEKKTPPSNKKKWGFGKSRRADLHVVSPHEHTEPLPAPPQPPPVVEVKLPDTEQEQNTNVYSAALATAEAAVAAAKAAAEVVRLTAAAKAAAEVVRLTAAATRLSGKSREEVAAIKIQTAFRAYLARRALRALRGLARVKSLLQGDYVKRQITSALHSMQKVGRLESEIKSRRIRMTEENQALQRLLHLKHERELEAMKASAGEGWDDSLQSKEEVEAKIMSKYEAAIRRERSLAYAFSHQWKNSSKFVNPMFTDPNNPQWGWSWMERWIAANRSTEGKETGFNKASTKNVSHSIEGEIIKAYVQRDITGGRTSPMSKKFSQHPSLSTPPSKASSVAGARIRSASPRAGYYPSEDDTRSLFSIRSEKNRRNSIAGSSLRDDESLASSPAVPNYMASTESARAKSRYLSLSSRNSIVDKASMSSVKKRLSFPAADKPGMLAPSGSRRHSGPPKIDVGSVKDILEKSYGGSNGVRR